MKKTTGRARRTASPHRSTLRRSDAGGREFDTSLPVLVVRLGNYPLHHGTLGVVRSLGRVGVPVFTIAERASTPAARSRYSAGCFVFPTSGLERPGLLVEELLRMGERIGRRALLVCTDDEAAVLVAEQRERLERSFVLPRVPPRLPRTLASKRGLFELCREYGVPSPAAATPRTFSELEAAAGEARFPLVVKNLEPFTRLARPAVAANTIVPDSSALLRLAASWQEPYSVLVQEYLPSEDAEDWIVHAYIGDDGTPRAIFTGFKLRSWPPFAGVTVCGRTVRNDRLAEMSERFCSDVGYRGVVDLDWRFDRRDGRYKLLDFNPRVGAQFRLFESAAGIDVVRAMHLDLSGREVPAGELAEGCDLLLEHLDPAARLAYRRRAAALPPCPQPRTSTRLAWWAGDDPVPAAVAYAMAGRELVRYLRAGITVGAARNGEARLSWVGPAEAVADALSADSAPGIVGDPSGAPAPPAVAAPPAGQAQPLEAAPSEAPSFEATRPAVPARPAPQRSAAHGAGEARSGHGRPRPRAARRDRSASDHRRPGGR